MKKQHLSMALLAGLGLSLASFSARADFIGLQIGGGGWQHDPSGDMRYKSGTSSVSADLDDDLHMTTKTEGYGYISIEHPVPLLPNVRLMSTQLQNGGSGQLSKTIVFNGITYTANENVTSTLNLNQIDLTLYWELLDNIVSLDFGLNLKNVDGEAKLVGDTTGTTSGTFSATIPMLYLMAGVSPWEGIFLGAEGSVVKYSGNTISDYSVKFSYTTDFFLGIEAGYRKQVLKLDDLDGSYADMEFSGPFAGVHLKF